MRRSILAVATVGWLTACATPLNIEVLFPQIVALTERICKFTPLLETVSGLFGQGYRDIAEIATIVCTAANTVTAPALGARAMRVQPGTIVTVGAFAGVPIRGRFGG